MANAPDTKRPARAMVILGAAIATALRQGMVSKYRKSYDINSLK